MVVQRQQRRPDIDQQIFLADDAGVETVHVLRRDTEHGIGTALKRGETAFMEPATLTWTVIPISCTGLEELQAAFRQDR